MVNFSKFINRLGELFFLIIFFFNVMSPIPKPLNKRDLKDLLDKLFFFYPTADFPQLKVLTHNILKLITKYFNFGEDEIDEFAYKMLLDYVNFQKKQPPYEAPHA